MLGGQILAGVVGPTFGWRMAFSLIGWPGLLSAVLVHCFVEEPSRGQMEDALQGYLEEGYVYEWSVCGVKCTDFV